MAYTESATIISMTAGSTFAKSDLYRPVILDANGNVVIASGTGNILPFGSLYGRTISTSTGVDVVPVAVAGVVKVKLSASTIAAGGYIAASSGGYWAAPTTDAYTAGQVVSGSSGKIRVLSARLFSGPLSTP